VPAASKRSMTSNSFWSVSGWPRSSNSRLTSAAPARQLSFGVRHLVAVLCPQHNVSYNKCSSRNKVHASFGAARIAAKQRCVCCT
jgi:hypothetical protein